MKSSRSFKLLGLIIGVVFLNIFVLSPGLLGVEIGGEHILETASGVTLLFISLLVVLYGSYILLLKPPVVSPVKDMKTHEDYMAAFIHYKSIKAFKLYTSPAIDQLERIEKKKYTLLAILSQRFDQKEISYKKFSSVIDEIEKLFHLNIRGILNELSVLDASEFAVFTSQHKPKPFSTKLVQEKTELYNDYLAHMTGYLSANEEILLKLDKLLLEISQLGSTDYNDIEEMPCMKEIDLLIKQTKFYKQ